MTLGAVCAVLAVLAVLFVIGQVWFHIVEGVLGGLKRRFGKKGPVPWHTLPQDQEEDEDV